jgi:hypothetical protein
MKRLSLWLLLLMLRDYRCHFNRRQPAHISFPMSTCVGSSVSLAMVVRELRPILYALIILYTIHYHHTGPILISEPIQYIQ